MSCSVLFPKTHDLFQCLSSNHRATACRVAEYGVLWRHLSKQVQDLGNAMGYTYGGQVAVYFTIQLLGTYGFISQIQQAERVTTMGFLITALIFTWLTYVFCNAADRATKLVRVEADLFQFWGGDIVLWWTDLPMFRRMCLHLHDKVTNQRPNSVLFFGLL